MTLEDLGLGPEIEAYRKENGLDDFAIGRVVIEHKERYIVKTGEEEFNAEILGNLRFTARERADFPAVGDWVAITKYDGSNAVIHAIFPRKSVLARQAVASQGEQQIIATNIDMAFIVQAVDRDFNINRIERYLTLCHNAKIAAVIILNKIDLIDKAEVNKLLEDVQLRTKDVQVLALSNKSQEGLNELKAIIEKGKTYCLLGSSGVGKSTLLNALSGEEIMKTEAISEHTERGKHITTHRELHVLKEGGILIDNPGMREVGLADSSEGLEQTFEAIVELAEQCKFKDCRHLSNVGCAVIAAVEKGEISQSSYENYLKLEREKDHYEATVAERRQKDKDFGKMIKQVIKNKKSEKF